MTSALGPVRQLHPFTLPPVPWLTELRPHQHDAVLEILGHYRSGHRLVVVSAPTGSGKTVIGATVALTLDHQSVYTCTTRHLQDQIAADDRGFGAWNEFSMLKGRSNYPTIHRPDEFAHPDPKLRVTAADCDRRAQTLPACNVCADDPACPQDSEEHSHCTLCCWTTGACPYEISKRRALDSTLACVNLPYFLTEANGPGEFSMRDMVIADECDQVESQIASYVTIKYPESLRRQLNLRVPKMTIEEDWMIWMGTALKKTRAYLETIRGDDILTLRRRRRVRDLLARMRRLGSEYVEGRWVYTGGKDGDLEWKPVRVDHLGPDMLWAHSKLWLLMSATVISADELVRSLGWDDPYATVDVPSTFPPRNRPIYPVSVCDVTQRTYETAVPKLARALEAIMHLHPDERILVHTVSYKLARDLAERVKSSRVVMYQKSDDKQGALAEYSAKSDAVMLAPSMDRGVDLPDDLARVIVVCKLPWLFKDRQVNARLYSPPRRAGQRWYEVQMARTLVQMTGRGVRHQDDRCVTYLLDSMFGKFWEQHRRSMDPITKKPTHEYLPSWWTEAIVWEPNEYKQAILEAAAVSA